MHWPRLGQRWSSKDIRDGVWRRICIGSIEDTLRLLRAKGVTLEQWSCS